ncbi:hypothetical protein CC80DRAFT_264607 [Byssothecium circinans]|uniref:CFEM domain-containing protein n=1 Tax=Byssothecium circinans TaxID=147558 RepID=A0A6A5U810_9PLEO|nr:hypothetical protein CC80DRAFT_264607 [Byssothecium circinans]
MNEGAMRFGPACAPLALFPSLYLKSPSLILPTNHTRLGDFYFLFAEAWILTVRMRSILAVCVFGMGVVAVVPPVASGQAIPSVRANSTSIPAVPNAAATGKAATGEVASVVSKAVVAMGVCPQQCWDESAAEADCDPNTDDDCLCGPFFDGVTSCVSETCSVGENLGKCSRPLSGPRPPGERPALSCSMLTNLAEVLNTLGTACDL